MLFVLFIILLLIYPPLAIIMLIIGAGYKLFTKSDNNK
jgi:hypothetical protein